MARERSAATVLGDFGRQVRDEPYHYVFKTKLWMVANGTPAEPLVAWLRKRYVKSKKGNRYRVTTYKGADGRRYVDYALFETLNDNDLVEMKLHGWNWSKTKIKRGDAAPRRKLSRAERRELNALIEKTEMDFYAALERQREAEEKARLI